VETHRIEPAAYGKLFHAVAEAFSRTHGVAFGAREHDLAHWLDASDRIACAAFEACVHGARPTCSDDRSPGIACAAFEACVHEVPLIGAGVIDGERRRLRCDVRTFIEDDWDGGRPRRFVAAERVFGEGAGVPIRTRAGELFVTGRIDRIDVEGDVTVVRDLKTGRARPRERDQTDPDVDLDLQLAVYGAVAERLADEWAIPADVSAAYVYVDHLAAERERSFRTDRHALRTVGERWLDLAMSLIRDQSYVQSPDPKDCRVCPFSAVCGNDTLATKARLRDATGALGAFGELKA
jgi:hypothetical protein